MDPRIREDDRSDSLMRNLYLTHPPETVFQISSTTSPSKKINEEIDPPEILNLNDFNMGLFS